MLRVGFSPEASGDYQEIAERKADAEILPLTRRNNHGARSETS